MMQVCLSLSGPLSLFTLASLFACSSATDRDLSDDESAGAAATTVAVLGAGTHALGAVEVTTLGTSHDGLALPRDLAFNPQVPGELWVISRNGPTMSIFSDAGGDEQTSLVRSGATTGGTHFMSEPAAIAFGAPGTFATAQEQDEKTQGPNGTPAEFMGPTLWLSDVDEFDAGHRAHIDMLHNSPNSVGIAWERDNVYWVFDGYHASITRYDFNRDHGPGGTVHSDGEVARFVEGQVGYEPDVPSHMAFDSGSGLLYAADTANSRVVVLDTTTGERGSRIVRNFDGIDQYMIDGADLRTLAEADLAKPSGLALRDEMVFVTDNETSKVLAFDLTGNLLDWLDTELPPGSLMGITFDARGRLLVVDALGSRVLMIAPR